jgi:hypothetical protein
VAHTAAPLFTEAHARLRTRQASCRFALAALDRELPGLCNPEAAAARLCEPARRMGDPAAARALAQAACEPGPESGVPTVSAPHWFR